MELYHGSIVEVKEPRLIKSDKGRDFGVAFYTTEIRKQAERWAWRHAKINRINGIADAMAVVSVFDFDDIEARKYLTWKDFPNADLAWLEFVLQCRSDNAFVHGYDVVTGKIANDRVGETISFVQQGVMRKEDALERLKYQHINSQCAFCTVKAINLLRFKCSYIVSEAPSND